MGIFSSKISYLGVDLGTSSIKIVEMANLNGRPSLVTYGFSEKKLAETSNDILANPEETAAVLSDICHKSHVATKKVIAALPNFSVFSSILNLPALSRKELESAISWEAKKIIPIPLEEIILDWKIITEAEETAAVAVSPNNLNSVNNGRLDNPIDESIDASQQTNSIKKIFSKPKKNLKILLTGASRKLVKKYIDVFTKAGLNILSLETESFALVRALIGNDKSVISLIDLGATTSSIIIVDKGIPVLSRSLEVGGSMITRSISNSLNVNLERAEQFKQDMSMDRESANNSLPQTVDKSFSSILNEIKYTLNLYQEQNNKRVEKIILTGGSALLGNLSGYLARILNINTYVGDPWARVVYPTELKPILDRLGARFAVAVGLSMRNIE